jgi:hypothetical protein
MTWLFEWLFSLGHQREAPAAEHHDADDEDDDEDEEEEWEHSLS